MRRIVLIVPNWLAPNGGDSVLRQNLPALQTITERGRTIKLPPLPKTETPEAAWLGLDPRSVQLKQGPLTVAALGADPPERSVHFHLSLMSHDDGTAQLLEYQVPEDELRIVLENAKRLNTNRLTIVQGQGVDHGLVWVDGSLDLHTHNPSETDKRPLKPHLPEGDGEPMLRRFIDDSINLLSSLPVNQERLDKGLQPLNLLWPWGQGLRTSAPNLWLQRGEQAFIHSGSIRLEGLSRLVKYRHGDRSIFGKGTNVSFAALRHSAERQGLAIIVLDNIARLRQASKLEEASWLSRELDDLLLRPLLDRAANEPMRLAILAPGTDQDGLGVSFESRSAVDNNLPFDERAVEEKRLERMDSWEVVEQAISAPVPQRETIA